MKKIYYLTFGLFLGYFGIACNSSESGTILANQDLSKIKLEACTTLDTFEFYQKIKMQNYAYDKGMAMFGIQGIRLGTKISEATRASGFTKKGTHLHLNVNNTLHAISNENNFPCSIPDGRHRFFAFIATPYYEAIKNSEAIIAKEVEIKNNQIIRSKDLGQSDIVYNAPRGNHQGDKVLLDFVLVNTNLAQGANTVRATIDEGAIFSLDKWQPYYIKGLEAGVHTVKLELLDATGKQIAVPVMDTFQLIVEPPKTNS